MQTKAFKKVVRAILVAFVFLLAVIGCNRQGESGSKGAALAAVKRDTSFSEVRINPSPTATPANEDPYAGMKCTDCHDDKLNKAVKHAPAVDDCTNCHAHHGTNTGFPFRLFEKGNKVCMTCHDFGPHFEVPRAMGPHPFEGFKDKFHPTRDFGCVSCHNPHSAVMPKLFRYDYREKVTPYQGSACAVCHYDIYGIPKPPNPPWE